MTDALCAILMAIPLFPLAAAVFVVAFPMRRGLPAAAVIAGQTLALVAAVALFCRVCVGGEGGVFRGVFNFTWFEFGGVALRLGLILDPVNAAMLVMVTLVGLLVCIYSASYMARDENVRTFFCFISFFSAAMLGLLVANSLLLLFVCWELVGLSSYLLIGFWYQKPAASAAAQKAFIVTRIGDLGLFLGMIWLFSRTGTLLFYDGGNGLLEAGPLAALSSGVTLGGLAVSTAMALLLFCGAAGKSGQFPLHVWLPDAMEGPTPVSALIHAATMVAAGVFLVARTFPLFAAGAEATSPALGVVAWVGAGTALFAALIAVAQTDIKRILAYSTISQLGFMMLCLGVGGVAAALFHLIAHAFFKALLFLGAGSVIHGCGEEQDIFKMGGLRRKMPVTFITYSIGMMALSGFPFLFSGFWSKEAILHHAHQWPVSGIPHNLALAATFLTAFYMSRQMLIVFFGTARTSRSAHAHESPRLILVPLVVLAVGSILPGFLATPAWPWFEHFINGGQAPLDFAPLISGETIGIMLKAVGLLVAGVTAAGFVYGRNPATDPLARLAKRPFRALASGLFVNEIFAATFVRETALLARAADWLDRWVFGGFIAFIAGTVRLKSGVFDGIDREGLNLEFDRACQRLKDRGRRIGDSDARNLHHALAVIGVAAVLFLVLMAWL